MPAQDFPLKMVGANTYGYYPKISDETTLNLYESDGWMVSTAGFAKIRTVSNNGIGRGLFNSVKIQKLVAVVDDKVYLLDSNIFPTFIGTIDTSIGDVSIAGSTGAKQIAICDKKDIWIYDYTTETFQKALINFLPGYVSFHDGRFLSVDLNSLEWRLSNYNDGHIWPNDSAHTGEFQTKGDSPVACIPLPGKSNNIFVMGSYSIELWTDIGYQLFPYQKASSFNIDYGCINIATIAISDEFVVWLGSNEKSTPAIFYSNGGQTKQISTDGINYRLARLAHPEYSYGFLYKQDGHLFYQITFYNISDNFTLIYDFNTNKFFSLTDTHTNSHIAKMTVAFGNSFYFVSRIDGNLYELNSKYTTYDGEEIPRSRICPTFRLPSSNPFIINSLEFLIEQGHDTVQPRVDISISRDGGDTFGNSKGIYLNPLGNRKNIFRDRGLGRANEFTPQFRFWGFGRVAFTDGVIGVKT